MTSKKTTQTVSVGNDLWAFEGKPLSSPSKANDMMWAMAISGFKDLGSPVTVDPRK